MKKTRDHAKPVVVSMGSVAASGGYYIAMPGEKLLAGPCTLTGSIGVIAGKLNCSVECSPLLGPQLMKAVKDFMTGKDLPVRLITSEGVFPAEVARKVLPTRKY